MSRLEARDRPLVALAAAGVFTILCAVLSAVLAAEEDATDGPPTAQVAGPDRPGSP